MHQLRRFRGYGLTGERTEVVPVQREVHFLITCFTRAVQYELSRARDRKYALICGLAFVVIEEILIDPLAPGKPFLYAMPEPDGRLIEFPA